MGGRWVGALVVVTRCDSGFKLNARADLVGGGGDEVGGGDDGGCG